MRCPVTSSPRSVRWGAPSATRVWASTSASPPRARRPVHLAGFEEHRDRGPRGDVALRGLPRARWGRVLVARATERHQAVDVLPREVHLRALPAEARGLAERLGPVAAGVEHPAAAHANFLEHAL